jgi:alpha-tubulin suppressor-like RCC1 family protein
MVAPVLAASILAAVIVSAPPAAAATATSVSAGAFHTCALTASGGVKCWGLNRFGELGDGTTTKRTEPVDASGLGSGVAAISAGAYHTCALTTSGGVKCWGYNGAGQLGDGTTTTRKKPVNVSGLGSGVAAISAGVSHTCALTTSGGVKCWGWNDYGQLGDGTTTYRTKPVNVSGLGSGVAAISAGGNHTCALTTSGGVKCWGLNDSGELGDGTRHSRLAPVDVSGLGSGMAAVSPGLYHTCALTTWGGVKCWGSNDFGELGDGTLRSRLAPVDVSGF